MYNWTILICFFRILKGLQNSEISWYFQDLDSQRLIWMSVLKLLLFTTPNCYCSEWKKYSASHVETGLWKDWIAKPHPYLIVLRGLISTSRTRAALSTADISLPNTMEPFAFQSSDIKCNYNYTMATPRRKICTSEYFYHNSHLPWNSNHAANILDVWNLDFSNANVKAKDVFTPTEKSMAVAPMESRALLRSIFLLNIFQ